MPAILTRRFLVPAVAAVFAAAAPAADPPAAPSLRKVPADVEAFGATLRLGETVRAVASSRAWAAISSDPAVLAGLAQLKAAYVDQLKPEQAAAVRAFFADPANRDLPALAADAVSREVFSYSGAGTADVLGLIQEAVGAARYGPLFQGMAGGNAAAVNKARVKLLLQTLAESPDRLRVPDQVYGFRVSDPAAVAAQLKRLEPVLADALAGTRLRGRSGRAAVGGDEFLVLRLDGGLVPWDAIPFDDFEDEDDQFAPLIKRLKALKLTVAVGVRQGYLLLAIGETTDHITRFGGGGPALAGRPELAPPAEYAGRPLTAVGYTSPALRGATATSAEDVAGMAEGAKELVGKLGLPDDDEEAVGKDLDAVAAAAKRAVVPPGPATVFGVATPTGWETLSIDHTPAAAGEAKPLAIVDHLGGTPLLAVAWRSGTTVDDYKTLVRWVATFAGHAEKALVAKVPAAEDAVTVYREQFVPLLKELSEVVETLWLPALAGGEQAVVLDAGWASKQWHPALPAADRPLPLPELGVVVGVADADKLERALGGYRRVVNKMLAKGRELAPTFPPIEWPLPVVERVGGRVFAHYPLPPLGIDPQFRPTGGLSDRVGAVALSRGHAARLLDGNPLTAPAAGLAAAGRPADAAVVFDWAGMVRLATPWAEYGLRRMPGKDADRAEAVATARRLLGVAGLFRGYSAVTYRDGGKTVTRGVGVFEDLPADAGR